MIKAFSDFGVKLPGCNAFGPALNKNNIDNWLRIWSSSLNNFSFFLILAGSRTAEVEGISAAGSTAYSRRYTAVADAEFLLNGPTDSNKWPLPPLQAGVSPALISYVAKKFLRISEPLVISVGLHQTPPFPHILIDSTSLGPAECLSTGQAMNIDRVENLWTKGISLGENLKKPLLIAECVPGGTTTAQAVLEGLGLRVSDLISGSALNPPKELKKRLVREGLKNANLGINPPPKELLAAVGDPFLVVATGILLGARKANQPVLLGGGCQMLAVLAVALTSIDKDSRNDFVQKISIGTTSWLVNEGLSLKGKDSSFVQLINLVSDYFDVKLLGLSSGVCFASSSQKALRDYEAGYIKEGVGAGALSLLAQLKGTSCEEFMHEYEIAFKQLKK